VYPIVYLALGVNMEGHKELLGMWLSENLRMLLEISSALISRERLYGSFFTPK